MADLTYTELVAEVRELLLQDNASNTKITDARAGRWINEAIRNIIRKNPGLHDAKVTDKTTLQCLSATYEYAYSNLNYNVAHTLRVWYLHRDRKDYRELKPYPGGKQQWDRVAVPCVQNTTYVGPPGYYWVRGGSSLEIDKLPDSTVVTLHLTGATGTDASPSVITKTGEVVASDGSSIDLTGKHIYLSGTNVTAGWYVVGGNTDDTITLTANASSGGAMSGVVIHIGGVIWIEYDQLPADISGASTPVLTDMNQAIVLEAMGNALASPALGRSEAAAVHYQLASQAVRDRVRGERPVNINRTNPYKGW